MRRFHVLIHSLLLVTSPSLLVYPQCEQPILQQVYNQEKPFEDFNLTYDEILKLLQDIEEEKIEEISEEKIERITHFIAFLAQKGMLPGEYAANMELENDIAALFDGKDNLFDGKDDLFDYVYASNSLNEYTLLPTILNGGEEAATVFLCKKNNKQDKEAKKQAEKVKKREKEAKQQAKKDKKKHHNKDKHHNHEHKKNVFARIKNFIVKHRKAIIIGAVIVIAAALIIGAVAAAGAASAGAAPSGGAAAAAGAAGAAAGAAGTPPDSDYKKDQPESSSSTSVPANIPPEMASGLKSAIDKQVVFFKENIQRGQFFEPANPSMGQQGPSWVERGRALAPLFAHEGYHNIQNQIPYYPGLFQEMQDTHSPYGFPIQGGNQAPAIGHLDIDRKCSTNYSNLYSNPGQNFDLNTLSHQVLGERALSLGYYQQAIQDFGKAIESNPTNPIPYLERGIANFGLGQYDRSLEDYHQFTSQTQLQASNSLSVSEFTSGFAKGLPKGVYDSGEGLFLFMADFVQHPIQTSGQIVDSITTLVNLVRNDEWGVVAEALSPEVHQLVTQWDTLPSEKKGELAGYAVGKHGADILAPGALAKVASKSAKSAQELVAVCKNIQIAQDTLLLETATGIGNSAKIAEVIEAGQKTARIADELGFTAHEMGQLKQAGNLESIVSNTLDSISRNPVARKSFELFDRAQEFLKPFKEFMLESECRELIHKTGVPTFPRPIGMPDNFRVKISSKGAGMIYIHPNHTHTSVRVMPGKPHSPLLYQQKPYVIHKKNGNTLDKFGNAVDSAAPEAHIPVEEFVFKD